MANVDDIVQITDVMHPLYTALLVVTKVESNGITGFLMKVNGRILEYLLVSIDSGGYKKVGRAEIGLEPHVGNG